MPEVSHRAQEALYPSVREMFELAAGVPGAISFAVGEPGFDTPRPMIDAAYQAAIHGDTHYTPNRGTLALRRAWCRYRARIDGALPDDARSDGAGSDESGDGLAYDPDNEIIVTTGGMNDHDFAVRLLHEAKVVVTPASGFGSRGRGYVRLSYVGTAEDTAEGLRRMRAWLDAA
ncbi:hypothetical protein BMYO_1707 [Bifidobacterium myosotis]|uniref:Aminotransferase class I/II-fold pyridoxal phosphate-dependent enzyme n=1 Tax=Bifidobacterium myosotis TaxID=1630166 RepID=A0A261FGC1_9BIFI|nr:hypothetical protein [Bifidobacterium myosotis]OZG58184.1 hypothetical protein BMYO_1707 [Bifidobacterium myosotis]